MKYFRKKEKKYNKYVFLFDFVPVQRKSFSWVGINLQIMNTINKTTFSI